MTDEPTYTLDQAQHLLVPVEGSACRVHCSACARTFDLVPLEEPI